MAGDKYLKTGASGFPTEQAAAQTSTANAIIAAGADGKINSDFLPAGVGSDSATLTAGEAISAGDVVYIAAAGTAFKADANAVAKAAVGFVLAGISSSATGTVYFEGSITGLTGLTPGEHYFLSNSTTGGIALYSSLTLGAGDIAQRVGTARSASVLIFEPGEPIVIA